jgi:hypothetical protein
VTLDERVDAIFATLAPLPPGFVALFGEGLKLGGEPVSWFAGRFRGVGWRRGRQSTFPTSRPPAAGKP